MVLRPYNLFIFSLKISLIDIYISVQIYVFRFFILFQTTDLLIYIVHILWNSVYSNLQFRIEQPSEGSVSEHFTTPSKISLFTEIIPHHAFNTSSPWQPIIYFFSQWIYLPYTALKMTLYRMPFCDCFLLLRIMFSRVVNVIVYVYTCLFNVTLYRQGRCIYYSWFDRHWFSFIFCLSSQLYIYLEVELQAIIINSKSLLNILRGTAKIFSKMTQAFHIYIRNMRTQIVMHLSKHILFSTFKFV